MSTLGSLTTVAATPARRRRTRALSSESFLRSTPFLLPALVLYGVFLLFPIVSAIYLSFYKWDGFANTEKTFVGIQNYTYLFTSDPVFFTALKNSALWVVASLILPTGLALLLAVTLNRKLFGRNLFRSVFYVPAVLASIAVATMWRWIYNPLYGPINSVLTSIGLGDWAQDWLGQQSTALYSVFIAYLWQSTGFAMVLFLAGLQTVPQDLLEAASLDGASAWQKFRHVTLPALRPTTAVVIVLTIINSLKVFDLIVGMTGGGPVQSTQVLALWSYQQSFQNHDFGRGNALAVILLVISLVLVVPYLLRAIRDDHS
jgi:raffinose/stachyose/melibiose transport system permease protein